MYIKKYIYPVITMPLVFLMYSNVLKAQVVKNVQKSANKQSTAFVDIDKKPVIINRVQPVYPESAKKQGIEGRVLIDVTIGTDGHVKSSRILKSDNKVFNEPALNAVKQYVFSPAEKDGKKVPINMIIPIVFKLSNQKVYDCSNVDKKPIITKKVEPVYPALARKQSIEGKVIVEVIVNTEGKVESEKILESSNKVLEKPALNAVGQYLFTPAEKNGKKVSVRMKIPVVFKLSK